MILLVSLHLNSYYTGGHIQLSTGNSLWPCLSLSHSHTLFRIALVDLDKNSIGTMIKIK